jgi:hypothetical protein
MPRRFSSAAMARMVVTPRSRSSSIIGARSTARESARAARTLEATSRAFAPRSPPSPMPCGLNTLIPAVAAAANSPPGPCSRAFMTVVCRREYGGERHGLPTLAAFGRYRRLRAFSGIFSSSAIVRSGLTEGGSVKLQTADACGRSLFLTFCPEIGSPTDPVQRFLPRARR